MSFGVRRFSKRVVRTSARSEDILSEEAWLDLDIGEYHVVNDPLVLSSSSDDDEMEQEDPTRRIERWMSSNAVVRMQTPDIASVDDDYYQDYSSTSSDAVCLVVPYLSEKLSCLTEYQLRWVHDFVAEMLPMLPRKSVAAVSSVSTSSSSSEISFKSSRNEKYRLPRVIV
ncbi:Atg36 [Kluyveromyces lactis]|nr:Atg36 [Kluyveromyces lactis]